MNTPEEKEAPQSDSVASPRVKMRMFQQMAEALNDEASALCRRAASFEEEESALNRYIQEHQTEINRLNLRANALRSERGSLMEKIFNLEQEAEALREEACNIEEDLALDYVENGGAEAYDGDGWEDEPLKEKSLSFASASEEESRTPVFFNRMTLTDYTGLENLVK